MRVDGEFIQSTRKGLSFVLALMTLHALAYALKIAANPIELTAPFLVDSRTLAIVQRQITHSVLTYSILSIPLLAGLFFLFKKFFHPLLCIRRELLIWLIAVMLSACLILGTNLSINETLYYKDSLFYTVFLIAEFSPFCAVCAHYFVHHIDGFTSFIAKNSLLVKFGQYLQLHTTKKTTIFLLLSWSLIFLFVFPGIYATDAAWQYDWFRKGEISAHHPPLHTLWLGGAIEFGNLYLGSMQLGVFLYSLSQQVILALLLGYFFKESKKYLPPALLALFVLLVGILPYNAIMSVLTTKDTIFSGLFLISCLYFYQIATDESVLEQKVFLAKAFSIFFLMCIFRNNGVYALIFGGILLVLIVRKKLIPLLLILVTSVAFFTYQGPVYKALSISPPPIKEMMTVPVQQISRIYRDHADSLSESEKADIKDFLPAVESYTPRISDGVRFRMNEQKFITDKTRFFTLWANLVYQYPKTSIEAFLSTSLGLWYPDMFYRDPGAWHPFLQYHDNNPEYKSLGVQVIPASPILHRNFKYYEALHNGELYPQIPFVALFFNPGVFVWLYLLVVFRCFYVKDYKKLAPFFLLGGLYGTMFFGPVILFRYLYPLILFLPIVFFRNEQK